MLKRFRCSTNTGGALISVAHRHGHGHGHRHTDAVERQRQKWSGLVVCEHECGYDNVATVSGKSALLCTLGAASVAGSSPSHRGGTTARQSGGRIPWQAQNAKQNPKTNLHPRAWQPRAANADRVWHRSTRRLTGSLPPAHRKWSMRGGTAGAKGGKSRVKNKNKHMTAQHRNTRMVLTAD